jgi:putative flippase GtrA
MTKEYRIGEFVRYCINGAVATIVHFGVLILGLNLEIFDSAGLANFVAAFFGISSSFLGNKCFVFKHSGGNFFNQTAQFGILYGAIAVLHGLILWAWTDWSGWDYRIGFLIATVVQFSISYIGNKLIVFKA